MRKCDLKLVQYRPIARWRDLFLLQESLATHRVPIKSVKEVLKRCEATESFGVFLFLTGITGCLPFTKRFPENSAGK